MAFDDVLFNVKSRFDASELQKGSRVLGSLGNVIAKAAAGMFGLAKAASAAGIAFKALIVIKVGRWLNDLANQGIAAAESFKQFQYETGVSAGHLVELQRELGLTGDKGELLEKAIKGDVAALRQLEEANEKVATAIRLTGQEAAGVAGMDPAGIYAALASQANISEAAVAATNERLTDMSNVLDTAGQDWEKFAEQVKESLGAAKDDIGDFLDANLKDPIGNFLADVFDYEKPTPGGTEDRLDPQGETRTIRPPSENHYFAGWTAVRGPRGVIYKPRWVEIDVTGGGSVPEEYANRAQIATEALGEFYEGAGNLSDELSRKLDLAKERQQAFNAAIAWVRDNAPEIDRAARQAAAGIFAIGENARRSIGPIERMGAAIQAALSGRLELEGLSQFPDERANLRNQAIISAGTITGLEGIGGLAGQGDAGAAAPAPEDDDVYQPSPGAFF